jgi:hypothetical protein
VGGFRSVVKRIVHRTSTKESLFSETFAENMRISGNQCRVVQKIQTVTGIIATIADEITRLFPGRASGIAGYCLAGVIFDVRTAALSNVIEQEAADRGKDGSTAPPIGIKA